MHKQISNVNGQIAGLEKTLEEEKKKMEADSQAKRAQLEAEIAQAKADIATLDAEQVEIRNRKASTHQDMIQARQAGDQARGCRGGVFTISTSREVAEIMLVTMG